MKRGALRDARAGEIRRDSRLAAEAARSLGCGGAGLQVAEAVIRAGMLQAGCGMLGQLLAADRGYRGPRVPCGQGHQAGLVSPVRDRDSSSYIATFEPASVFADLVKAEGARRSADHVRQFTILGDGAAWIWNIASSKFPEATQIVDLYHAREHLHDLARLLEFMLLDLKDEWLAARIEDLDYEDIDGTCRAARAYPLEGIKKGELDTPDAQPSEHALRLRHMGRLLLSVAVLAGVALTACGSHPASAPRIAVTPQRCPGTTVTGDAGGGGPG
ncbi:MAG TPA: hypothetical protein VIY52_29005, partial [Streptosporangiaceae bacterium]